MKVDNIKEAPPDDLLIDTAERGIKTYKQALAIIAADRDSTATAPPTCKRNHACWKLFPFSNYKALYVLGYRNWMYISTTKETF